MAAMMSVRPTQPSSVSTLMISASSSRTSSAVSVFGMRITSTPALTTASTSLRPYGVLSGLMRTTISVPPKSMDFRALCTSRRAASFSAMVTESSRSSMMESGP